MFRGALMLAVCWLALLQAGEWIVAEDNSPGVARVSVPPPADGEPEPLPIPEHQTPSALANRPVELGGAEKTEGVAEISSGSSDLTIRIGPAIGDPWPKPKDFSDTRWWPSPGGMQWMPGHRDRFGMFSLTGGSAVAWGQWDGLWHTSGYGVHFLNGPVQTDLPARLFDLHWGLHWAGELTPGWSASLSGQAGLFTDFEDSVRDGWRFPAHAIVFQDWTDTARGVAGVQYLDRENLPALPVLGVIFRPDDRLRLEAIFPEPRIAWRVHAEENLENWISLSGEIGGGEWAIERSNTDRADVVTYNDYSAVLGFHHYTPGEVDQAFEIGYVFARDLEYRSGAGNFEPADTFFLRITSRF